MRFFACLSRTKRSSSTAAISLPSMYRAADGSWLSAPDRPRMVNATGKPLCSYGRTMPPGQVDGRNAVRPNKAGDYSDRLRPRVSPSADCPVASKTRQARIQQTIQGGLRRPVAQEARAVAAVGAGEAALPGMLAHDVEVDQAPAAVVPEQVVAFEIAVADALADQRGEQPVQRRQLGFRRAAIDM